MKKVYEKEREKHGNLADYGNWLGYLVEEILGEDPNTKDSMRCRGTYEILDTDNPSDGVFELRWFIESAWCPCYKLMHDLAKHFGLNLAWTSEEPGMGDYMCYDPDGYVGVDGCPWRIQFNPDEVELDGDTDLYDELLFYRKEDLMNSWLGKKAGLAETDTPEEVISKLKKLKFYADPVHLITREAFEQIAADEP